MAAFLLIKFYAGRNLATKYIDYKNREKTSKKRDELNKKDEGEQEEKKEEENEKEEQKEEEDYNERAAGQLTWEAAMA